MVLKIELDKNLEKKFRETAMKRYGYSRGSLKKAAASAITEWTARVPSENRSKEAEGKRFMREFLSVPKIRISGGLTAKKIKRILEEQYDLP